MSEKLFFLERLLGSYKYSHNTKEAEFYCCFCFHYKKKLSINIDTDNWHCWVCEKSGKSLIPLIRKVGNNNDFEKYVNSFKAKNVTVKEKNDFFRISLPKEYTPIVNCMNSFMGKRAAQYLKKRGISEEDMLRHKIGIVDEGKFSNRLLLPSFDKDGNLNFFTCRDLGDSYLKYLDPDVPKGYKRSVVFNELNVDWEKPVVLVEGFFDMVKAGNNAIPIFGSYTSKESSVFQKIVRSNGKVFLALDPDAQEKAHMLAENFMGYDLDVYTVQIGPFKDAGEMTKEEFKLRLDSASPMTRKSIFQSRLEAVCQ